MSLVRAAALVSCALVLAACASRTEGPPTQKVVSLPPNTELTGKYWITCKPGFTTEIGVEGCVPVANAGENPTTIVEIPNSSGRWGADTERERKREGRGEGPCCADGGGMLGCIGGTAVCADGTVAHGCACVGSGLGGLGGLDDLIPTE